MKLYCRQADLYEALSTVVHALSTKSAIPALDCVQMTYEAGCLTLVCTDLNLTITRRIPAESDDERSVLLLPAKLLTEIVRKLPDDQVTIEATAAAGAHISAQKTRTRLQTLPPETFPELTPVPDEAQTACISRLSFRDMIRQCVFAAATDDLRPILTGCLLECEDGRATMVALDSYRMAIRRCGLISCPSPLRFVIPAKHLAEIARIIGEEDDTVNLRFGGSHLHMALGSTTIMARLLEGEYIKYRQIIPAESAVRVTLEREQLSSCIERATLIAREDRSNLIRMELKGDSMVITSNSDQGDLYEVLDVSHFGDDLSIAFNVRYISDVLRNLDSERLTMCFNTPVSPCSIVPDTGDTFLYLVLPVRVS